MVTSKMSRKIIRTTGRAKNRIDLDWNHPLIVIAALLIITVIVISITASPDEKKGTASKPSNVDSQQAVTDEQILERLKAFQELDQYAGYNASVTRLERSDLKTLTEKQPVIYSNISGNGLYRIEYFAASDGYLIIYDAEINRIIREFHVMNIQLN